jgi:hypothetical protein
MRVAATQNVYTSEAFEPDAFREHRSTPVMLADGHVALESSRADVLTYRRTPFAFATRVCERCACDLCLFTTVYIEHDAPHLMQMVRRGLQHAGRALAMMAIRQGLCFCGGRLT